MRKLLAAAMVLLPLTSVAQMVKVTPVESERRIDITVDGKPFTSYMWPTTLEKPVLYPLTAPDGTIVTRGYPLKPQKNERTDHPHHAGLWFNYGNVNGFDFWNNSDAIKPEQKPKMGSVHHTKIVSTHSGQGKGDLTVESIWTNGAGQDVLRETTQYVFGVKNGHRYIDRIGKLTALEKITFNDDKEGVLGIRVARWLESPTEKGGTFLDASGNPTQVAAVDNSVATGVYLTSEGIEGDKVWSTRGRWCVLAGHTPEGKKEAIAIIDNPKNPGYPTYWHARGYGLFAANPLGAHIFNPKAEPFNYTVEKGKTVTFTYRVLLSSSPLTSNEMNHEADAFAKQY